MQCFTVEKQYWDDQNLNSNTLLDSSIETHSYFYEFERVLQGGLLWGHQDHKLLDFNYQKELYLIFAPYRSGEHSPDNIPWDLGLVKFELFLNCNGIQYPYLGLALIYGGVILPGLISIIFFWKKQNLIN